MRQVKGRLEWRIAAQKLCRANVNILTPANRWHILNPINKNCKNVKKIRERIERTEMTIYQYEAGEGLADTLIITDADARNIV